MKEVYGDDAPSNDIVKHSHRQFKCGRTSVKIAPIPGWPYSDIDDNTIHKVEAAILEDCGITIQQLAREVKINVGSMEKIIHDHLPMQKLFPRWIPLIFTPFQKQEQVNCS
ncbi:protein GVQW3-like [Octopus sinensis]|uniref:Protein GVQW3-like n=1 Tax=Octopus sinensis TaxID=2607531 RepID=A0A6P7TI12_9MOLL|nr:protein GVQW3-like [Octopus sinensis]